jgi:hypothetical protein
MRRPAKYQLIGTGCAQELRERLLDGEPKLGWMKSRRGPRLWDRAGNAARSWAGVKPGKYASSHSNSQAQLRKELAARCAAEQHTARRCVTVWSQFTGASFAVVHVVTFACMLIYLPITTSKCSIQQITPQIVWIYKMKGYTVKKKKKSEHPLTFPTVRQFSTVI